MSLRLTNQNNAAQTVELSDTEILLLWEAVNANGDPKNCRVKFARALLSKLRAPVARQAQPSDADITHTLRALDDQARHARHADGEMGVRVQDVMIARAVLARYGHTPLPMADAASQVRPFDDDLWDQALKERDHYHDMADRLASAIGTYFGADVGEHSSSHSPWREALAIIDEAAPQVSVQDVRNAALEQAYEAVMCVCAADYQQSELSNFDEPLRALKKAGDYIRALKPPKADKLEVSAWFDAQEGAGR